MKKYVRITCNSKVVAENCEVANNVFSRFMGLMFRKSMPHGNALLLEPCNEIHTFNMKFSIDVVTLYKNNEIAEIFDSVPKGKVKPAVKGGAKVIELNAGEAKRLGLKRGDVFEFEKID